MVLKLSHLLLYNLFLFHMNKNILKQEEKHLYLLFFCFLPKIDNIDLMVEEFWIKHEKKIKTWYLKKRKKTDLVISASPTFLLKNICKKLEIMELIGTEINLKTGELIGKNCKGEEKAKRYKMLYGEKKIDEFYSDSKSDLPLKEISQKSFLVKKDKIKLWQ